MNTPRVRFFISTNGQSVAYASNGSGPFLLLPAWWVSHLELDWQNQGFRHFFEALGKYHTIVRYDRPGVGLSERKRSSFEFEDEILILSELIQHIKVESFSLLGISCGGPVATVYAQRNPHRVEKLVLVNSFVDGSDIGNNDVKQALCSLVSASWGLGAKMIIDLFDPDMPAEQRKELGKIHKASASSEIALNLLKLTFSMNAVEAAKNLIKPALVLHRNKDHTISVDAGKHLAAMIPNAEFKSFDGKSHLPWIGLEADQFVNEILSFTLEQSPAKTQTRHHQFQKIGDVWVLSYAQKTVHLKDALGLRDLGQLISNPGKEIHARFLASGKDKFDQVETQEAEILDSHALKAYRDRILELEEAQQQASKGEDETLYAELENERDTLQNELTHALGLSGRQRRFNSDDEKARKAISARIRSSIKRIESVHAELAEHLTQSISTGNFCRYNTAVQMQWQT
ncbi:MAG: pimeloyl-ACP methyl ester carboxylesterase [Oleiphilaceae bacterium]|jgi:pimeloyl-ACP methyl ester carboxylesterase